MKTITIPIIPLQQTFAKVRASHALHYEAICVFVATGFFLEKDSFYADEQVL